MTRRMTQGKDVGGSAVRRPQRDQRTGRALFRASCIALLSLWSMTAKAQSSGLVQPKPTAEDVPAAMVHHAGAISAGEVYAIRMPQAASSAAAARGIPSSRSDAVEIEFRVDMGIRGTSIGSNYVLRMPAAAWQQGPPLFALHQRSVTFLKPLDSSGLSGPVQGAGDPPGQALGVLPVDENNQVDLSRLARLVTGSAPAAGNDATAPASTSAGND